MSNIEKPIHVKPSFYAYLFEDLKVIAKRYGYNLVLHGSLNRDLDLIAIPWVNKPQEEGLMITEFEIFINGIAHVDPKQCMFSILPGGRKSYVININRGGKFNGFLDCQFYVDISITPLGSNDAKEL